MKNQEFSYIYPANYSDRYDRVAEEERRNQLADELAVDMGNIALIGFSEATSAKETGSLYPEQTESLATTKQVRGLGAAPLGQLVELDRSNDNALTNKAVLGYAEQQRAA